MGLGATLRLLARQPPPGMSRQDAVLAGLVPPPGWQPPPRDRPLDLLRTVSAIARMAINLARTSTSTTPSTTTSEGLAYLRTSCRDLLAHLHVQVTVEDNAHGPHTGGVVYMWNQTSHLDHLVLPLAIPRPFHMTFNNEIRRTPLYGDYLARTGHFWLDRTDETQWRAALAAAAERIRAGAALLVSPEGTRSWDGHLLPMKRGAFLLARAAASPIVCLTVLGARDLLPRGRAAVRPGHVHIVLEPAIPVDPSTSPDLERLVATTFERTLTRAR